MLQNINKQEAMIFNKNNHFLIKLNKIFSRVYFENARKSIHVLPVPGGSHTLTRLENLKGPTLI